MKKEEYDKLSTFDKIEYDIDMQMYMEHNDKIASIYDHLGEVYGYQDLEDAKALEEHETFELYKKVLKEKCDAIDKAIEYINKVKAINDEEDDNMYWEYEVFFPNMLNILQGDYKKPIVVSKNVMIDLNGKNFRCTCGGNVFTKYDDNTFICNGCGNSYEGDDNNAKD